MIRISIIDDHPVMITGISNILSQFPDMQLMGAYLAFDEFLTAMRNQVPDILLLDIQMPEATGDKIAQQVLKLEPQIKIVAFSNFDSPFYVENMLRYGARGYLLKSSPQQQIAEAIRNVYAGEEYISPVLQDSIQQFVQYKKRMAKASLSLTDREKQIIQLVSDGYTTKAIAERLYLSYHTVENYRDNIMMKLDVKNSAELIKKAIKLNIVN